MEVYNIENLTFSYPNRENRAIDNICLSIEEGEFVTLCGKSGCGKTTLLRLLKSSIAPHGDLSGRIYFEGKILDDIDSREQAARIGFVMQNPDNQIVTDKVWHELAFGLESLGYSTTDIRTRVSEMASFFGIQSWFHKKTTELSGGQKQLLNLASVMVMQPSVLILDEPMSQLDPIAAQEFLKVLEKINRELGVTVIISEHRLEDVFSVSDRVIVMDSGKKIADAEPKKVGEILKSLNHDMLLALPVPMRIYYAVKNNLECPITVRDGRNWLEKYCENKSLNADLIPKSETINSYRETAIEMKDVWFRYEKHSPDIIKGLNVNIYQGEFFAIVGGNGTGKTTALSVISGINTAYRGEVLINGEKISNIDNPYKGVISILPQDPKSMFVKKTVYLDLLDALHERKLTESEKENYIGDVVSLCQIDNLLDSHPYDLSGGEQQRVALAKVLLMFPKVLLFDEPTKGLDAHFKQVFADILYELKMKGVTIVIVSHDIEFCAEYADRCAMFFDGNITSFGTSRDFFKGNNFYTTSANRMARARLKDAVLTDDVILACGGAVYKKERKKKFSNNQIDNLKKENKKISAKKPTPVKIILGSIFTLLFVLTSIILMADSNDFNLIFDVKTLQIINIATISAALLCYLPKKEFSVEFVEPSKTDRKLTKRAIIASLFILFVIPITIYIGVYFLNDRKYYFISMMIILETFIPFAMFFEKRKPQAREIVAISVLCVIAVAGRAAFFMLPQFKPIVAILIIVGICFGSETGFLVGAISGFISNFFFGQGPLTPWQMFSFGMIGFIAGILFRKGLLRKTKISLCIFGFVATFVIYGGIMNPASVIVWQSKITKEMILSSYIMGIPYDLIHALSTVFFLWFISEPMIDKLERIKIKYGLMGK